MVFEWRSTEMHHVGLGPRRTLGTVVFTGHFSRSPGELDLVAQVWSAVKALTMAPMRGMCGPRARNR
jgi:hypothetical protein